MSNTAIERIDEVSKRRRLRRSSYGKRGSIGVTSGKKLTTYMVVLPDGREVQKGSYRMSQTEVWSGAYWDIRDECWKASGIFQNKDIIEQYGQTPCRAVKFK